MIKSLRKHTNRGIKSYSRIRRNRPCGRRSCSQWSSMISRLGLVKSLRRELSSTRNRKTQRKLKRVKRAFSAASLAAARRGRLPVKPKRKLWATSQSWWMRSGILESQSSRSKRLSRATWLNERMYQISWLISRWKSSSSPWSTMWRNTRASNLRWKIFSSDWKCSTLRTNIRNTKWSSRWQINGFLRRSPSAMSRDRWFTALLSSNCTIQ